MAEQKNLCALIPIDLHDRVSRAKNQAGLTTAQYITNLLTEYFEMKENGGTAAMTNSTTRTMPSTAQVRPNICVSANL